MRMRRSKMMMRRGMEKEEEEAKKEVGGEGEPSTPEFSIVSAQISGSAWARTGRVGDLAPAGTAGISDVGDV